MDSLKSCDNKKRSYRIDALKGIAMIAVVLYHFSADCFSYGYLGVDIFFVISGYFMMHHIIRELQKGSFNYKDFIIGKISRLLPLVVIFSIISFVIGYFTMLPDDYENLSESIVASNLFANNILEAITTRNYWDIANVFKPLMHTWYLGVLMQTYVIIPLIILLVYKCSKKNIKSVGITSIVLTAVSFLLYLNPNASQGDKFYGLFYRLFEIMGGGV